MENQSFQSFASSVFPYNSTKSGWAVVKDALRLAGKSVFYADDPNAVLSLLEGEGGKEAVLAKEIATAYISGISW